MTFRLEGRKEDEPAFEVTKNFNRGPTVLPQSEERTEEGIGLVLDRLAPRLPQQQARGSAVQLREEGFQAGSHVPLQIAECCAFLDD